MKAGLPKTRDKKKSSSACFCACKKKRPGDVHAHYGAKCPPQSASLTLTPNPHILSRDSKVNRRVRAVF